MTQRPAFRGVTQIGLVVRSVEATAKRCWESFGMGPWTFYTLDPSTTNEMTIRGKRVDHAMRIGSTIVGQVEWEIIEPLDDRSIYAEHLRVHGEGLHHVLFDVESYGEAKANFWRLGIPELASGNWSGHPFNYFDARDTLGCFAEIWLPTTPGEVLPPPDGTYP